MSKTFAFVLLSIYQLLPAVALAGQLQLPDQQTTAIEVYFPQKEIEVTTPQNMTMMGGGAIGGAVAGLVSAAIDRHLEPALNNLGKAITIESLKEPVLEVVKAKVDPAQFPSIRAVAFHESSLEDHVKTGASLPDEQVLVLTFRYYFTQNMGALRVSLNATVDARKLLVAPTKKRPPMFTRQMFYDVPAKGLGFLISPREGAEYWTGVGAGTTRQMVVAGVDELLAMLSQELTREPTFGRIAGKQLSWNSGMPGGAYGVAIDEVGDRLWIRLRNGSLASIPKR
ncbi:MAG: hypothetical protein ACREPE_05965 [Lysobacter sp.]